VGTLLILTAAALMAAGPEPANFEWHGSVARGSLVEIRGITGDIRAVPSTGTEVEVIAKVVQEGTREPIDIQVREHAAGLTVCAVRGSLGSCPVEEDPLSSPATRVDYVIKVPEGVHFAGRTVNGGIQIQSLESNVEAYTVNGTVEISTTGTAQARTVNGSIRAQLLKPFWSKPPEFSTVNGAITLHIPTDVSTDVKAETRNGKVVTEVPFRGDSTDQTLDGKIGRGGGPGNPLLLRSINGSIEIRQRY
jgi:hypothetical protein